MADRKISSLGPDTWHCDILSTIPMIPGHYALLSGQSTSPSKAIRQPIPQPRIFVRRSPQLFARCTRSPERCRFPQQRIAPLQGARSTMLPVEEVDRIAAALLHRYASFPEYTIFTNLRHSLSQSKLGWCQSLDCATFTATVQLSP